MSTICTTIVIIKKYGYYECFCGVSTRPFLTEYLFLLLKARVMTFFKLMGVFRDLRDRLDLFVESRRGVLSWAFAGVSNACEKIELAYKKKHLKNSITAVKTDWLEAVDFMEELRLVLLLLCFLAGVGGPGLE